MLNFYHKVIPLVLPILMASCDSERIDAPGLCTEIYSDRAFSKKSEIKAVGTKDFLWPHKLDENLILVVCFLDGEEWQRQRVRTYAKEWTVATNGKVEFRYLLDSRSADQADIRITFKTKESKSAIGSDAWNFPSDTPTMYFGWIDKDHNEDEIRAVVLHEFGHALGLEHEHQHPEGQIPWDSTAAYAYYLSNNPTWSKETVDIHVFDRYNKGSTNYDEYDPRSIMHYGIPAGITKNRLAIPNNTNLSKVDKRFIRRLYQKKQCPENGPCCIDEQGTLFDCALGFSKAALRSGR